MDLTERQQEILDGIVSAYIKLAKPISSQLLEEEGDFSFSPATMRNEMLVLSEKGFLEKPYISSGRIPTDKGYRFFVDRVMEREEYHDHDLGAGGERETSFLEERGARERDFAYAARHLAHLTSALTFLYLRNKEMVWKEGWEDIIEEPEFADANILKSFARFIRDVEEEIREFSVGDGLEIFIGGENPFSRSKDFSIIIAEREFAKGKRGLVALVGPKRMTYEKNIHTLRAENLV